MRIYGILAVTTLLAIAGCERTQRADEQRDLPGSSRVVGSTTVATQVLDDVIAADKAKDPACDSRALTDTRVIGDQEAAEYLGVEADIFGEGNDLFELEMGYLGYENVDLWIEKWTIDRCDSPVAYIIAFFSEGTTDSINYDILNKQ